MKNVYNFLNGKKTTIAAIVNLIAVWVFQKGWIEQGDLTMIAGVITAWTGTALFHKAIKKGGKK